MSGLEIIGVVLGTWPIVIELVKVGRGFINGVSINELRLEFDTDLFLTREFVSSMLESIEDLPEKDRIKLSAPSKESASLWQAGALEVKLRKSLGQETISLVVRRLNEINLVLGRLRVKLGPDGIYQNGPSSARDTLRSWKDARPGSSLRLDLVELRGHVKTLRKLLRVTTSRIAYDLARPTSRRPGKLSDVMKRLSKNPHYFNNFYNALDGSFHCTCTTAHAVNVRLQPDSFETLVAIQEELDRKFSEAGLDMPASGFSESPSTAGYRGVALEDRRHTVASSSSSKGEQRALPIIFIQNVMELQSGIEPIPDLCNLIRSISHSGAQKRRYAGYLGQEDNKYLVKIPIHKVETEGSQGVMCLEDCLTHSEPWGLSWRKRVDLAHSLTLSIFQFYPSQWIDKNWSWRDFSMCKTPKQLQLFITRKFYSNAAFGDISEEDARIRTANAKFWKSMSLFNGIDPALGRLGCALVELAMERRLSEMRDMASEHAKLRTGRDDDDDEDEDDDDDSGPEIPDAVDFHTARRLLEADVIREQTGDSYHKAVEACLLCEVIIGPGSQTRHRLSSKSDTFLDDFEKYVVEPLRDYQLKQWGEVVDDGFQ